MSNDLFSNVTGYICTSCGAEVIDGNKFCSRCGTPVQRTVTEATPVYEASVSGTLYSASDPAPSAIAPSVTDTDFIPNNKSKYQPISTGGYIGIWLLMMLPAVNLLLLIVWACGGCRKLNKRNLARSMLIIWAILLILGVILAIVFRDVISSLYPFAPSYGSF